MSRHQDQTVNHILESWTYANAAARTGAVGFVTADIGRIAYQTDTGQYWRLTATTPTWAQMGYASAGTLGYVFRYDGASFSPYPLQLSNSNVSDNTGFAADQYVVGSNVVVAAGDFKAKGQYRCIFDMTKTAAGAAALTIDVRIGTLGALGDASRMQFVFGAGTAVVDTGIFEVIAVFRSVGAGTSAVISGMCRAVHNLATTGLFSNAAGWTIIGTTSAGFASNTATTIGVSFNGGASFVGTNTVVQATLQQ